MNKNNRNSIKSDLNNKNKKSIDFKDDFFSKPVNLTVSGQLNAELGALALSEVYTFGPTFRAENSNTSKHLAEFWMIEPEMAFYDINDNMDLAEEMLKYIIKYVVDNCIDDLKFLEKLEINDEKKLVKSINLDDFSFEDLKEYIQELKDEIQRAELEVKKKSKAQKEAEKFFK